MTQTLRGKLIRLAYQKPELRPHVLPLLTKRASGGKVTINRDFDGFKESFPGYDNQVYDSHLIDSFKNSKTVVALAKQGLMEASKKGGMSAGDIFKFLDDYVEKKSNGRFKFVRWNSKSYPD